MLVMSDNALYSRSDNGMWHANDMSEELALVGMRLNDYHKSNRGSPGLERKHFSIRTLYGSNVPLGNSPVMGYGIKKFGLPISAKNLKFKEPSAWPSELKRKLNKRLEAITEFGYHCVNLARSIEEELSKQGLMKDPVIHAMVQLMKDQVAKGSGFDNGKSGDLVRQVATFDEHAQEPYQADEEAQRYFLEGIEWNKKDYLAVGIRNMKKMKAIEVSSEQNKEGRMGILGIKADQPVSDDTEGYFRILYELDVSGFIKDFKTTKGEVPNFNQIVDWIMEQDVTIKLGLHNALVDILQRIQNHGYKVSVEENKMVLEAKDGKVRLVSTPDAFVGKLLAMIAQPFVTAQKKLTYRAGLLPPEERDAVISEQVRIAHNKYQMALLPTDESAYDQTIKAENGVTIVENLYKPLTHSTDQHLWEAGKLVLGHKVIVIPGHYETVINEKINFTHSVYTVAGKPGSPLNPILVYISNGLGSGIKITGMFGSDHLRIQAHYVVPKLLNYTHPREVGQTYGDDNAQAYPYERINVHSVEETYKPIEGAFAKTGMKVNSTKQILVTAHWKDAIFTVMCHFLQFGYLYDPERDYVYVFGAPARYASKRYFAEKQGDLSDYDQLIAQVMRHHGGRGSVDLEVWLGDWLAEEERLLELVKSRPEDWFIQLIRDTGGVGDLIDRMELDVHDRDGLKDKLLKVQAIEEESPGSAVNKDIDLSILDNITTVATQVTDLRDVRELLDIGLDRLRHETGWEPKLEVEQIVAA